ncbi:MAG: DUF554 domain-containing protein [Desulfarculaceae bacterium]|nr:DUF554 domain-containing protein [Desulfarculaceae bacterium]
MTGTLVNTAAVIAGSLLGLLFRKGIPDNYNKTVIHGISLAVILIGFRAALESDSILIVIISLVIGSIAGEALKIESKLEALGQRMGKSFSRGKEGFTQGFVTASLLFCVGSLAIVGSLESGLTGDHQTLFAKSILDGVTSVILTSSLGIGVIFSALSIFLYQGSITLAASMVKPLLVPEVISQMTAVGGLLIIAIGLNLLEMTKIRIGNMLPAIFIPLLYYCIRLAFS